MIKRNHLSNRSVLCLTGKDRHIFLQGLVTNDILSLKCGTSCWTAFLNTQGRIQNIFFVFATKDALFIDIDTQYVSTFQKQIKRFRLRADVTIDLTDLTVFVGSPECPLPSHFICCTSDPRHPKLGWRAIVSHSTENLLNADEIFLNRRLSLGIPEMSDLVEPGHTLALEANMDVLHGISWDKGCYLGQEITARMHYRSHAKRRIIPISFTNSLLITDKQISLNGKNVGDLRSYNDQYGLAMLHHTVWNEKHLTISGQSISLLWPNWLPETLRSPKETTHS